MFASAALLGACGTVGRLEENGPGIRHAQSQSAVAAAQSALERVHAGDTREQVAAALGPSNILAFETGWQVWIYRWPGADSSTQSATELIVLFEPGGTVRKVRVRRPPSRAES
jgi:outer membrane protein assembly factor BamE (lipoprotein component of BamABCDE complex)